MGYNTNSDFLVAAPSFVSGAARLLDWYGQFDEYNESSNGAEADCEALSSDWSVVGESIAGAMAEFDAFLPRMSVQNEGNSVG